MVLIVTIDKMSFVYLEIWKSGNIFSDFLRGGYRNSHVSTNHKLLKMSSEFVYIHVGGLFVTCSHIYQKLGDLESFVHFLLVANNWSIQPYLDV